VVLYLGFTEQVKVVEEKTAFSGEGAEEKTAFSTNSRLFECVYTLMQWEEDRGDNTII